MRQVLGHIIWVILMALIMGWLARSRLAPHPGQTPGVLRYPRSFFVVSWVCFGFFVAAAMLSSIFPGKAGPAIVPLIFLGFSLIPIPAIAEFHRVWFRLEADGMSYGRWFGNPRVLHWSHVTEVRYSESLKEFRIEAGDAAKVRVSVMLSGLPEFAETVLREVPEFCMDRETRRVLGRTARGHPPAIWM